MYIKANVWYFDVDNTWSYKSKPLYLNFEKNEYEKNNIFKAFLYTYDGVCIFSNEHYGIGFYEIHIYIDAIVNIDNKYYSKSFFMGEFKYIPYFIDQNYKILIKLMKSIKYPCGTITKIRLKAIQCDDS